MSKLVENIYDALKEQHKNKIGINLPYFVSALNDMKNLYRFGLGSPDLVRTSFDKPRCLLRTIF